MPDLFWATMFVASMIVAYRLGRWSYSRGFADGYWDGRREGAIEDPPPVEEES